MSTSHYNFNFDVEATENLDRKSLSDHYRRDGQSELSGKNRKFELNNFLINLA